MDLHLPQREFRPTRVSGAYPAPDHIAPRRPLGSMPRIPVVVIHPGSIERLGIHYSWSTSAFVEIGGVGADDQEIQSLLRDSRIRVALLGLASVDRFTGVSEQGNVAIIGRCLSGYPAIKWIVWANQPSSAYREAAQAGGAIGYFDTPMTSDQLESAVEWAAAGRAIGWTHSGESLSQTSPPLRAVANDATAQPVWQLDPGHGQRHSEPETEPAIEAATEPAPQTQVRLADLSPREREVLQGLALGQTNQQIAEQLYLSVKTIETYRSRLKDKLGIRHRSEMVAFFHSVQ